MSKEQERKPKAMNNAAELNVLKHLQRGWKAVINRRTFYVVFVRSWNETWVPPGPTGATVARMMRKGLIDFERKGRTICGLEVPGKNSKRSRPK